jgi:pentatricopeptide repeat protein
VKDGCRPKFARTRHAGGLLQTSQHRTSAELRYADIFSFTRQQLRSYASGEPAGDPRNAVDGNSAKARRTARRLRSSPQPNASTVDMSAREGSDARIRRVVSQNRIRRVATQTRIRRVDSQTIMPSRTHRTARTLRSAQRPKLPRVDTPIRKGSRVRIRRIGSQTLAGSALSAKRRIRALNVALKSMDAFRSHYRHSKRSLLEQGIYRSLRRRIITLERTQPTLVDITKDGLTNANTIRAFAALDQHTYRLKRLSWSNRLQHDPQCASWAAMLFPSVGEYQEKLVWEKWQRMDVKTKETFWPSLLIYLLDKSPSKALLFLRLLNEETAIEKRRPHLVADALEHLSKFVTKNLSAGDRPGAQLTWPWNLLIPTFCDIFRSRFSAHPGICSQDLLLNITKLVDVNALKQIFDMLAEAKANMRYETVLHYANTFAKAGEHEYALLCLKRIAARSADTAQRDILMNRERCHWTCALIIRKSMAKSDHYHETTGIVAALVELGVRLNTLLYNAIISNAMEAGDYTTAFAVYNNLGDNGLEPNEHTFSILLHGCTMTDDPAKFQDFAEHCAQVARELRDPWLATDCLYYLYVRYCGERTQDPEAYNMLSRAYQKMFSTTPLEPLWNLARIPRASSSPSAATDTFTPMEPPPLALYIMLQAGIRHTAPFGNNSLWNLFLMFTHLTQTKYHPALVKLAKDPVIWNAFLLAFCRARQFDSASRLVKHMTDHSPQPNVYSWNIFMQGFFKTGQVQAAERVFEIMRSRGIEPDQFTYGTLLRGYVRVQHYGRIEAAMELVDAEDQMDPKLLQALAKVHDRQRLTDAMERAQSKRLEKEEEKARVAEAKERWTAPTFPAMFGTERGGSEGKNIAKTNDGGDMEALDNGRVAKGDPLGSLGSVMGRRSVLPRR